MADLNQKGPLNSDTLLLQEIFNLLNQTSKTVQQLAKDVKGDAIAIAELRAEFSNLVCDFESLARLVKEGNGGKSMLQRLNTVEHDLGHVTGRYKNKRETASRYVAIIIAALIGGIFGSLGHILTTLFGQ
jgi:hypothetical protein